MSKLLGVRLDKSQQGKLTFLYNLYQIESKTESIRFRKLLDAIYSEKLNPSDTPTLSTTQHPELELLDDWDCAYRAVVYQFDKISRKKVPFVHCSAVNTRRILGTNIIDIAVCKKCNDRGASTNFVSLPAPKKEDSISKEKEEFLKRAQSKNRKCITCGADISNLADWKTRCLSCWRKNQNSASPFEQTPKPLTEFQAKRIKRQQELREIFKQ